KHEYDLSPIYAELPKDSKALPKIANVIVATMKHEITALEEARRQELKADIKALEEARRQELKAEIKALEEARRREIKAWEEERRQETINIIEKKERERKEIIQEISDLRIHMKGLEIDVKKRTELLLLSTKMCNVRGALEFIRAKIPSQDKTVVFHESVDNVLMKLTQDAKFISYLKRTCSLNNFQYKDVEKCMGGLYHTASKQLHGHETDIGIDARDWTVNEVLALGVLFYYYNIPYLYYNEDGKLTDYPYKLADLF
ncbi:7075_t:CDS:2, partial [Paraglomus occultum]